MKKKIIICNYHSDYPTPLIWTFVFRGAEFWCPYCGHNTGLFGGITVDKTPKLTKRLKLFNDASKEFLSNINIGWQLNNKIENKRKKSYDR